MQLNVLNEKRLHLRLKFRQATATASGATEIW